MRILFLTVLLTIGRINLMAQSMPQLRSLSQDDTIRAIERLFTTKRSGGKIYTGVGVPLLLVGTTTAFLVTTLATSINAGKGKQHSVPTIIAGGSIGLVPISIGLIRQVRFSRRREQTIISTYQDKKLLPRWVQRRLRRNLLRENE